MIGSAAIVIYLPEYIACLASAMQRFSAHSYSAISHFRLVERDLAVAAVLDCAINAMIAPWFDRDRPKALAHAFNRASVGGVVFTRDVTE